MSDRMVRAQCSKPSVDCLLVRHRLKYIRRICSHSSQALYIILCMRVKSVPIPWVKQLKSDFIILRKYAAAHAKPIVSDDAPLDAWMQLFDDREAWNQLVDSIFYIESTSDRHAQPSSSSIYEMLSFFGFMFRTKLLTSHFPNPEKHICTKLHICVEPCIDFK